MRATSGPVRGTPATILSNLAPHAIILVRGGTPRTSQDAWVDFSAAGAETVLGVEAAGRVGIAGGVAVYWAHDADVEIGDVFRHEDTQYKIEYRSFPGWGAIDGDTIILSWGEAMRAP